MNKVSYMCYSCKYCAENNPYCEYCNNGSKYEHSIFTPAKAFRKQMEAIMNSTNQKLYGDITRGYTYGTPEIKITKVIFNPPATIVFWSDNTKTVVKCGKNDTFDHEKGLAMAICKKSYGNKGNYYNIFKKWIKDGDDK